MVSNKVLVGRRGGVIRGSGFSKYRERRTHATSGRAREGARERGESVPGYDSRLSPRAKVRRFPYVRTYVCVRVYLCMRARACTSKIGRSTRCRGKRYCGTWPSLMSQPTPCDSDKQDSTGTGQDRLARYQDCKSGILFARYRGL